MTTLKKRWVQTDGWRGYYQAVPPEGWELLTECDIVNEAGEQCRNIITTWLRKQKIHFRSGYLRTCNVFSANLYIVVEGGKIDELLRKRISRWFVNTTTSTFSVMTGREWPLDIERAQYTFDAIVSAYGEER